MIKDEDIKSIYNKYVDDLYSYAIYLGFNKEVVMDAIHDVFCKLCIDENTFFSITNIKFYLFRSLKNRLLDIYKQQRDMVELSAVEHSEDAIFFTKNTPDTNLMMKEHEKRIRQKIDTMLQLLSPRQREIVYLRYVQAYDYEQISEIMEINLASCRKLLHKALQTLREKHPFSVFLLLLI
ncbi:MAG: RNA polymerase sigma factor [Bacteroidia bacterium]|nr:RNA polymerase sigma factor [Bacteroidia bacterium]